MLSGNEVLVVALAAVLAFAASLAALVGVVVRLVRGRVRRDRGTSGGSSTTR